MDFPVLKTNRLILNELLTEDKQALFEIYSDPEVVRYYDLEGFTQHSQAEKLIDLFNKRFNQSLGIRWAIRLQGSQQCIGTCGFNAWNMAMRSTTVGYDLHRQYWRQGIMTEALKAIIFHAFSGKLACENLNRIQADTIPGNIASEKVLRKLGFQEEGLRRQSAYWKNAFHDLKCFGLLKHDFLAT